MERLAGSDSDLALAQSIVGPIDIALESLAEAAKALGEISEIMHRYIAVNEIGVKETGANKAGAGIDLARQGGTEVGPAEHI